MMRGAMLIFLIFISGLTYGQISVAVTADRDSMNFGDEVELSYQINIPTGVKIVSLDFSTIKSTLNLAHESYPEEVDSLMDIDIIDGGVFNIDNYNLVSSAERLSGPIPTSGKIKVRISSIGALFLPKPIVNHNSNVQTIELQTPGLMVKPLNLAEELNPNYSILEEEVTWKDYLFYAYIYLGFAAFLLSLYFIITYFRKGKKGFNVQKEEIILPADVVAIRDLKLLQEKELWQNGDAKSYHTELTRIMRQYIEDRYEVQALEMTSSQLKREMTQQNIDKEIIARFDEILMIADKVKFAKGEAGPEINEKFMGEAYDIVEQTKIVEKEEVEE